MKVEIGDATLYHGDCLEILPTLEPVDAVVTDPPYGIAWTKPELSGARSRAHNGIENDFSTECRDAALEIADCVKSAVFGSFLAPPPHQVKQTLVWHKPGDSGLFGTVAGFRRDVEPIYLCGEWPKQDRIVSSILTAPASFRGHAAARTGSHPHAKPVELLQQIVDKAGQTILDPFMGSGTTGVACANLGRKFIGIEIEKKYFDIACERIDAAYAQGRLFE